VETDLFSESAVVLKWQAVEFRDRVILPQIFRTY